MSDATLPPAGQGRSTGNEAASPEPAAAPSVPFPSAAALAAAAEEPAGASARFPPQGARPAGSNSCPSSAAA